ncbi:MAG: hypothetical protein JWR08_1693 [Enterovirga sp.]|jgi:ElaB/YqjD/DUF883 family membrane-anchored ribosome-binding protein|nr:hypothetical protein [Enterovirga sp.]
MNEVEKHYSGQGGGTGQSSTGQGSGAAHGGGGGQGGSSAQGSGRSGGDDAGMLGKASATAKDGLKGVADTASQAYDRAASIGRDSYESASRTVGDARRRSAAEFSRGRRGVETFVEENPIMVGVVGLAAGLLVGALLPGTRRENQVFGRYADEVKDQGLRYARELAEQGKHLVEENLDATLKGAKGDRDTGDESRAA